MERKTAIVTGAGTGIGQGVAITLGQNGYDVVVHYNSSAEGAEEACRRIRDCGGRAWPACGNSLHRPWRNWDIWICM